MATPSHLHSAEESSYDSMRLEEIYSGQLASIPITGTHASTTKADGVYVSSAAALRCARGALIALGLEAAAAAVAIFLYGMIRISL